MRIIQESLVKISTENHGSQGTNWIPAQKPVIEFFFKTLQLNSMYVRNFKLKYEVRKLTLIFTGGTL
jgi:hypothetical protein